MALGRGSAVSGLVLLLCSVLLHSQIAHAATFTVGAAAGWTFNTVEWPDGKQFSAGDTLVFNYIPGFHDVVVVDKVGYDTCQTPTGAKVFLTGMDEIELLKGDNYFICNFPGHCESGMKIAVNAA